MLSIIMAYVLGAASPFFLAIGASIAYVRSDHETMPSDLHDREF